jgi:hypothetical protein
LHPARFVASKNGDFRYQGWMKNGNVSWVMCAGSSVVGDARELNGTTGVVPVPSHALEH